jgi:hypothetical protein
MKVVKSKKYTGILKDKLIGNIGEPDTYVVVVISRNRRKELRLNHMNDFEECNEEEVNKFKGFLTSINYKLDEESNDIVSTFKPEDNVPDFEVGDVVYTSTKSKNPGIIQSTSMKGNVYTMGILSLDADGDVESFKSSKDVRRFGGVRKATEAESKEFIEKLSSKIKSVINN